MIKTCRIKEIKEVLEELKGFKGEIHDENN